MTHTQRGLFYAGLATLFWSTVAAIFKITLRFLSGDILTMLCGASLVSLCVLAFIIITQKKYNILFHVQFNEIVHSAILGALNPFVYYLILFKAYHLLPGQEAQPLNFTWPIILTILTVLFLKQKLRPHQMLAIYVSFFGVIVISTQGRIWPIHFTNPIGVLLSVGSSLIWATYWIFNMKDSRDTVVKLFYNFLFGFFYCGLAMLIFQRFTLPDWKGVLGIVWIGIFEMGITFVFWMKALELAPKTSMVSNLVYLCPFISLFFLHWIAGETILLSSVAGLIFIVSGIYIQTR